MRSIQLMSIIGLFLLICQNETSAMCLRSKYISGGEDHSMVLTQDGSVFTCGLDSSSYYNYTGALGIGNVSDPYYVYSLTQVLDGKMQTNSGYLENIEDISAGWTHSLALDEYGYVFAWGGNRYGQLGDNQEEFPDSKEPVHVWAGEQDPDDPNVPLQDIVDISAGRSGKHSLAVDKYGLVWSWGINEDGQLGDGSTNDRYTPVAVHAGEQEQYYGDPNLIHIINVSAGAYHSMALEDPNLGGYVYAWGWGSKGVLGNNFQDDQLLPVQVHSGQQYGEPNSPLQNIVAISAGWHHSMALEKLDDNDPNSNGRVYTWGWNGT